ncbi:MULTISPECIES: NAD(P)H-dependent amine dehydrogenase family protein [Mycobacteriales]|uniref:Dihydrodipicolinate reductase n=2 Tax=Actinomycetes TaxID=1760 RepID=C3UMY1_9MICO|nr:MULTISPECIES: dihydrodipicolinate reductase [Mycobacteriales]ACO88872.1 dihydrodipicolinate reductase [Microbacterium sp. MA1]ART90642.1 dihydrodipicolinate reductase [Rhodococcus rhodochrous]NCL78537.1 2,4-diaminopentanoate dehydrogenase [Rhodococcus sp. YH1]KAF0956703.1 2,4-diaminopentanoate dehydrogenase [Rhodococcus sp. T7]KAF0966796.1 2,4-diaminopentanoate dehydrogenase [Rhodococcus sp. T7]
MTNIRAVVYGVGAMNSVITRYLLDKDVEIVGAISRSPDKVGKDLGEVTGLDRRLGVSISDDPHEVFTRTSPDIAVVAITSYLVDAAEHFRIALSHGVNVITLSEEALYPWNTAPELTAELDALAKEHGVTITGGGFQDSFWVNAVAQLMGTAHRIDSVTGTSSWNVDEYGPELAELQQVGATIEEFDAWCREAVRPPTFGRIALDALVAGAGLTPKQILTRTEPELAHETLHCAALGIDVPPGKCIGFTDIDEIRTEEGPVFVFRMSGRLYGPDDSDVNEWTIHGEPDLVMSNGTPPTMATTCTQLVNRIPDVLDADPGFVTVVDLPRLRYRHGRLHDHLSRWSSDRYIVREEL